MSNPSSKYPSTPDALRAACSRRGVASVRALARKLRCSRNAIYKTLRDPEANPKVRARIISAIS